MRPGGVLTPISSPLPSVTPVLSLIFSSLALLSLTGAITLIYLGENRDWEWLDWVLGWLLVAVSIGLLGQLAISIWDLVRHIALSHS